MKLKPITNEVAQRANWEVVVLGAGPAGALAARQLALSGRAVLLVEKARMPRTKVCGGCLGGAALSALEAVGLGRLPAHCGGGPLTAMRLSSGGIHATIAIDRRIAVARDVFDAQLVVEAAAAGATVLEGTRGVVAGRSGDVRRTVILHRDGQASAVRARVVLVATGLAGDGSAETTVAANSRIGLGAILNVEPCTLGAAWRKSGPVESQTQPADEERVLQMAWSKAGYVGMAPLTDHRIDIAAAIDADALARAGSPAEVVGQILDEAGVDQLVNLAAAHWRGTPALTRRAMRIAEPRMLRLGDAAGYIEPFTGEGIGWAMHTAVLASSLVARELDRWSTAAESQWEQIYRESLQRHHRYCYAITRLMRCQPLRYLAVRSLRRAPGLARPLVRHLDRPLRSRRGLDSARACEGTMRKNPHVD